MRANDFLSVAEELLPAAIALGGHLESAGYTVKVEPFNIEYPRTPCFIAKRQHTTMFVEVQAKPDLAVIREWVRYGKGCPRDTRITLGLSGDAALQPKHLNELKTLGAGVYMPGDAEPYELVPANDLALNLELPELPPGLRRILGNSYSQFQRGQWREGFEEACLMLEQEARSYLHRRVENGRTTLATPSGSPYTAAKIKKIPTMTMGTLATTFEEITSPNSADTRIGQALKRINPDRITVAHYKGKDRRRENSLRKNVARNMFVIVGGLRQIKGIRS